MILYIILIWWNFTDEEYLIKESESLEKPLFLVGTNTGCPHCVGLPESLNSFSETLGNKTKVIFSNVNCGKVKFCKKYGFKGVPFFILIRGKNQKYWGRTYESKPIGWMSYLSNNIGSIAEEIPFLNNNQYNLIEKGGSHFHFEINENSENLLKHFQHFSSIYRIYDCTFSYKFINNINSTLISIYSPICINKILISSVSQIENFIISNLFSGFHHYNFEEIQKEILIKPLILFIIDDSRNGLTSISLKTLFGKNCQNISFGWVAIDLDPWILEITNMFKYNEPFIVGFNKNCMKISLQNAENTLNDNFINLLLSNDNCLKMKKPSKIAIQNQIKIFKKIFLIILILIFIYFVFIIKFSNIGKKE